MTRSCEAEDVLHGDGVVFHPNQLADLGHFPAAVGESLEMHDHVDGADDLRSDRPHRQVEAGHEHQRLDPRQRVAWLVGMKRRHRAVVPGVHGLQHVERFSAPDLADDEPVGPHAQRAGDQLPHADGLSIGCGRPRLEPGHVALAQPQLGGVFNGDYPVVI